MPEKHGPKRSFLLMTILWITILLICIQFHTFENIKKAIVADPEVSALNPGLGGKISVVIAATGAADWVLLAAVILSILSLVFLEWRTGRISCEIGEMLDSERSTLILVAALSALAARFYIAPGLFSLGDSSLHVYRAWCAARSLSEGHYPFWSFFNYGGYPFLQFYGPLFYLVTASTAGILGSIDWSAKMWLFLLHWGSAFPVYYWARTIGARRGGAVIASIAYVLSFLHTHTIIWTGALETSGIFLTFPLVLLSIERILTGKTMRWIPVLSISTACMILFHQGYAIFALQLAVLYALVRWAVPSGGNRPEARFLILSFSGIATGLLVSSFFLWNILFNKDGVYYPFELPLLRPGIPSAAFLKKILLWRNMWSGWTAAYIGLSIVVFAVLSCIPAWKRKRPREIEILRHTSIIALFAILSSSNGGRTINLALPFLCVSTFGVILLFRKPPAGKTVLILLAILFLDLGPTTIQSPYRSDQIFLREGMQRVSTKVDPHRAVYGYSSAAGTSFLNWTDSKQTDLILPTGFFPQGAPHSLNSITAMVDMLNGSRGMLTEDIRDALYLWDVSAILTYTRTRFIAPHLAGLSIDNGDPPFGRILPASPLIFSEEIVAADDDSLQALLKRGLLLDRQDSDSPARKQFARLSSRWIRKMEIDRERATAKRLFVPLDGAPRQAKSSSNSEPDLRIEEYEVGMVHVSIRYTSRTDGYLRAAFSWYPDLEVRLDGAPAAAQKSLLGAIILPTPAGGHLLEIVPVRRTSTWSTILSLTGLLLTGGLYFMERQRCKPTPGAIRN